MNKNILIINEYAGSPSYGMTFRHYYLAKEFIKKNYNTTIVSASYSHFLKKYPDIKNKNYLKENVDGVPFLWVKVMKYSKSFDKKRALKWLDFTAKLFFIDKYIDKKPDVIICSTTELFAIIPAYYLAKKYKAKLVFEVRDIWPLTLIKIGGFSEKNVEEEVKAYKGWQKVNELGFLNRDEVSKVYSQSKAGLVTLRPIVNYLDALPVKMFEYMAAGLPVISSDIKLWKKIIDEAECGICVNPLEPKEIAQAIEYIISHPKEAELMGQNGKKAVLEKYNWGVEEKKLFEVYDKLLS
jgi:glycosyltransferase involved in cell wall biosynthesis